VRKALRELGRPPATESRAEALAKVIRRLKPDIVHSMEIQHAGYLTLEAKQLLKGEFPPWLLSNWGSDIYLFGQQAEHQDRIRAVLQECDYYTCECARDVKLALDLGFDGTVEPVLPCGGGFDVAGMQLFRQPGPTASRRLILLKGYHNWAGRALYALEAIRACADELQGYRVVTFLTDPEVAKAAERISKDTGIPIDVAQRTTREGILRLFGSARIYMGLSISDGISTSLLEAMIMGAFPIQSCTACADEWIISGTTGLIVPPEDQDTITAALHQAILNDELVDQAAKQNSKVSFERLDLEVIRPQVIEIYQKAVAN
jgi:glycosyltransferase involved in cell wall biosynthesis